MQDVSRGKLVREDCNLIIDGKTIKANKGDLIIGMYSPKNRFDIEFFVIPGTYFGNLLETIIAEETRRKNEKCECKGCCDTCECFN